MTKVKFWRSFITTAMVALCLVFVTSIFMVREVRVAGEIEASQNLGLADTPQTTANDSSDQSARQKGLKTYLQREIWGPVEVLYAGAADVFRISERYWRYSTAERYIKWLIWTIISLIGFVIATIAERVLWKKSNEEDGRPGAKKQQAGFTGLFTDAASRLTLNTLTISMMIGALFGSVVLVPFVVMLLVWMVLYISFKSNGGRLAEPRPRNLPLYLRILPRSLVKTFGVDENGLKNRQKASQGIRLEPRGMERYGTKRNPEDDFE